MPGVPDFCAVLCHGITVDREEDGVFTSLAESLAGAGIPSFRFDFRGHGMSGGKFEDLSIGGEAGDLRASLGILAEKGYSRFAVVAASFAGGAAALVVPGRSDISALVLWNAVVDYKATPVLSESSASCRFTIGDRVFRMSPDFFAEMDGFRPADALAKLRIPVLLVHGDRDDLVPFAGSAALAERIPGAKLATIPGSGHGFHGPEYLAAACRTAVDFLSAIPR